jgi:hypothetical protein
MSEQLNAEALLAERPVAELMRLRSRAVSIGAIGLIGTAIGFFIEDRSLFFQSYLIAYIFWLSITMGSMALLMVQYLSGGAWGMVTRRVFEAAARTFPLMLVLFLPIALNLQVLYPWTRPGALADEAVRAKAAYLNEPFFFVRLALFFAAWILMTYFLTRWSRQQDESALRAQGPKDRRFRTLSGPGLVIYMLTLTFMSTDWVMSLDPHFSSTIFGILMLGGQGLSGIAFAIVILALLSRVRPMSEVAKPDHFHDLGKLMLAFVMLWAYFQVSQLIIVWSGNLPEEINWYLRRMHGVWTWVAILVVIGHFALPFALLLSEKLKRNARSLARLAVFVLVMRVVEVIWTIAPVFRQTSVTMHWLDFAIVLGMGAIWLFVFFGYLAGRALVPAHDPRFKEAMAHGGH